MVHIERFILPYPNLISVEGLRSLGKLLGQLPIFRRDCSSLPGNWNVPRRGMPGHSVFDGSLFIVVPCLPHVRLGLMMLVTLTHHSSLSNFMPVVTWKSNCVFASRFFQESSATQDYIRQFGPLVVAGDRLHRRPPQLMLQVVVVILSTRLIRV